MSSKLGLVPVNRRIVVGQGKMHESMITPDEALIILRDGNLRYVTNSLQHPNSSDIRRSETATEGQTPFVTILSCSDSRVPVEKIFDRGIGDIFVVRVAGNVLGSIELASVEYAVDHLATPAFVVLGHTKCGAVTAVVRNGLLHGTLKELSEHILPSVEVTKSANAGISEEQLVTKSVKANIWKTIERAFRGSSSLKERAKSGKLKVIGAVYDVHTGAVLWMGSHRDQERFIAS